MIAPTCAIDATPVRKLSPTSWPCFSSAYCLEICSSEYIAPWWRCCPRWCRRKKAAKVSWVPANEPPATTRARAPPSSSHASTFWCGREREGCLHTNSAAWGTYVTRNHVTQRTRAGFGGCYLSGNPVRKYTRITCHTVIILHRADVVVAWFCCGGCCWCICRCFLCWFPDQCT